MKVPLKSAASIVHAAFPDFKRKEIKVEPFPEILFITDNYCPVAEYYLVRLTDLVRTQVEPTCGICPATQQMQRKNLPADVVLVACKHFSGISSITIWAPPECLAPLLAPEVSLTFAEKVTMHAALTLISSARLFHATRKITVTEYEEAKLSLMQKGLMRKNGSLNIDGQNMAENTRAEVERC